MGGKSSKQALDDARERAKHRVGSLQVSGRYHRLPRRLQDDYCVDDTVLGTGFSGAVRKASRRRASKSRFVQEFAVKSLKIHGISKAVREALEAEVEVFLSVDHPHVCRLHQVYESENHIDLVMECLTGGELLDRINQRGFSERDCADAAYQMLLAINYLHGLGIVHRDIKLENFLFEDKDSSHLKLIDFGFSNTWDPDKRMKLACGTLAYTAPEVILKNYDNMCDLWSLGVVVFLLLVGQWPFPPDGDPQETEILILNGDYVVDDSKWRHISRDAFDFVQNLLERDPNKRLTAEKALAHPWITTRAKNIPASSPLDQSTGDPLDQSGYSLLDQSVLHSLSQFAQASKFRRACFQVMAWSLTLEERAEVREAFLQMDVEKKGTVKLWQMKQILDNNFNIDDEKIQAIINALDSSNQEEIRYSDFLAAMLSSRIKIHEDLVFSAFRQFDPDDSGYISVEALQHVLSQNLEQAEAEKLIQETDLPADGRISYDDFIQYLTNGEAPESHQVAAGMVIEKALTEAPESCVGVAPSVASPKSRSRRTNLLAEAEPITPTAPISAQSRVCTLL